MNEYRWSMGCGIEQHGGTYVPVCIRDDAGQVTSWRWLDEGEADRLYDVWTDTAHALASPAAARARFHTLIRQADKRGLTATI